MNAFNKKEIAENPFLESCDIYRKLIYNWDWMQWSFITHDGKIVCNDCRNDLLKELITGYN